MLTRLGSDYGGWWVDLDLIKDGDLVLDCGVGYDLSFSEALLARKNIRIIGVDPSRRVASYVESQRMPAQYEFRCEAISGLAHVQIFKNQKSTGSESVFVDHSGVNDRASSYMADGVSLSSLVESKLPSLVKLDIEGAEYGVYRECFGVKQVCIEFHHGTVSRFSDKDTWLAVNDFKSAGYSVASEVAGREYLFIQQ